MPGVPGRGDPADPAVPERAPAVRRLLEAARVREVPDLPRRADHEDQLLAVGHVALEELDLAPQDGAQPRLFLRVGRLALLAVLARPRSGPCTLVRGVTLKPGVLQLLVGSPSPCRVSIFRSKVASGREATLRINFSLVHEMRGMIRLRHCYA